MDPCMYGEALTGGYVNKSFIDIEKIVDANCPKGKAAFTIAGYYTMGTTGVRVNEYDQTKAMENADLIIASCYANGRAVDDNVAVIFDVMDTDGRWTSTFAEEVEKTEVVKSVKVTENGEASDTYASGTVYDSDISTTSTDIEVEVVAFPADTLAKLRGDNVDADGLILSGGNRPRPYFAYGKVVKLRKGGYRYDWYPKCKLSENSDDISTSEEKANEQTDTIKIKAYPFNEDGDIVARVESASAPEGLTEEKFFSKPVLTKDDLVVAVGKVSGKV